MYTEHGDGQKSEDLEHRGAEMEDDVVLQSPVEQQNNSTINARSRISYFAQLDTAEQR